MSENGQTQQSTNDGVLQSLMANQTNPVTGISDNHAQILQALIDKSIKQHGQDFINQVGPEKAQQLVDLHNATSNNDTSSNSSQGTSDLQQQALNVINPKNNIGATALKILGGLTGIGPMMGALDTQRLNNIGSAQRIAAGQPGEIALPQAQAAETQAGVGLRQSQTAAIQQKIEGKEPLQAVDYANIVGSMNTLNLDALKTASQKMEDDLKERQNEIDTSQKTINMMGRLGGMFSNTGTTVTAATQKAQDEIKRLKIAKSTVDSKIATFKPRNPVTNKVDMEAPAGATHYSPSTGKYYDSQGNEMK